MKQTYWAVNKRGFGSVYALGMLWIVVAFVLLMITQAITFAKTQHADYDLHYAQLYAIYHVKAWLHEIKDGTPVEENQVEGEEVEEVEVLEFPIQQETCTYANQTIHIMYDQNLAWVTIGNFAFRLTCDFENGEILELAYS